MAIEPTSANAQLSGVINLMKGWWANSTPQTEEAEPSLALSPAAASTLTSRRSLEAQALFDYKKEALDMAAAAATARGDEKFTMTDYVIAAERLGETKKTEMAAAGITWNPKVYSDLSEQEISGAQINKTDMRPDPETLMFAAIRAQVLAQGEGRAPTKFDTLAELQKIQRSGEKVPSLESMRDAYDLDGDHTVGALYADMDRHAKFENTVFSDVSFHPAGTLMRHGENGVALTEGAAFSNVTFNGMGDPDVLTLNKGRYENIHFTNIKGGTVKVVDGTQVDGMDMRGVRAALEVGRASISNLDATHAHILHFNAAPGAEFTHAIFDGATIDMNSKLQGSVWKDASFKESNLIDVDMSNATLSNVRFSQNSLAGLNLTGAKINDLVINGQLITDVRQLGDFDIITSANTTLTVSPEMRARYERVQQRAAEREAAAAAPATPLDALDQIRNTMQAAIASIGTAVPAQTADTAMAQAQAAAISPSIISGGETVNFNDITQTVAVSTMERTVPLEQQASGANMSVERNA